MNRPTRKTALIGLAVLGAAVPASAQAAMPLPEGSPIPAGVVQHTVTDTDLDPSVAGQHGVHIHTRVERWATTDSERIVTTDRDTGKVTLEVVDSDKGPTSIYNGDDNTLTTWPTPDRYQMRSWAGEGSIIKQELDSGYYKVTGDTTYMGAPAKTLVDTNDNGPFADADQESIHEEVTADAATFYPLTRSYVSHVAEKQPDGSVKQEVLSQSSHVVLMDTPNPSSVKLSIGSHAGAKVINHGLSATAARKLTAKQKAARKRALARKRAAAKRAAARKRAAAKKKAGY